MKLQTMRNLLLILLIAIGFANCALAYDFSAVCSTGQTLYYNITSNEGTYTVEVTSEFAEDPYYTDKPSGDLEIPESVENDGITYSVTGIGTKAFYICTSLLSVALPNTLTNIGDYAFRYSGIIEITIPEQVYSIGSWAFGDCGSLTTVNYNAINCTYMGGSGTYSVFTNCGALTTLIIGENVVNIPEFAFCKCYWLPTITIPSTVATIGNNAFLGVKNIVYEGSAEGSPWGARMVNGYIEEPLVYFDDTKTKIMACFTTATSVEIPSSVTGIGDHAFEECSGLTSIVIPNTVTDIGDYVLDNCSGLSVPVYNDEWFVFFPPRYATEYTIPEGIKHIAGGAFSKYNNGLTLVTIPNTVTTIGNYAFYLCNDLMSIAIPDSVTTIGNGAFSSCSSLTSITIPESVTNVGSGAFEYCYNLTTVNFNAINCTSLGSMRGFGDCNALTTLNIGENVTRIPDYAFYDCDGLTGVLIIPNSVTEIGVSAFYSCGGFSSLTISENLTSFGRWAFGWCTGLTGELTIPNSVTNIGDDAFRGCSGLTSIAFGSSLAEIGPYAFSNCEGLTSVTIPNTVTSIGNGAFYECNNLTTVNFNATNCTSMGTSGYYAFTDCPALTNLTIGENVTRIPNYAFYACEGFTDIYVYSSTPPTLVASSVFKPEVYSNATVWTPCPAAANYRSDSQWGQFANISNETTTIFNIAVQTADANMGDVSGEGGFTCDTEVTLTATPNDGYRFLSWNDGNEDNPRTITVGGDSTFVASFRAIHTITASAGEHGSIFPSGDVTIDEDADQTFTISPDNCYQIASVLVDGVEAIDELVNGVYTFLGVADDHTIEVTFALSTYTISVSAGEHGTITHNNEDGNAVVNCGGNQSFIITPETYYHIASVIVDGQTDVTDQLVDGVYTFENVTESHTISAIFEVNTYTISATVNNEEFGHVAGDGTYDAGTEISITATPNDGYRFVSWNDANTDNPRTLIVTSDSAFVAIFVRNQFTITVLSSDSNGGYVTGEGTYPEGDTATLTATPSVGYCFISWNDGGTDNPRMVEVVQDSTFVAEFSATVHRAVDTTVTSYLTIDEHTFYVSGIYSYVIPSDEACDTIVDLTLRVLDEPQTYDISPNPAKSLINISSENYISMVEIYSTTGRLVMQKEINAYQAEINIEGLVSGVYFVRLYGEDGHAPSVQRFVKE